MAKCKQCDNYISHNYIIYSCDIQVCSNNCAMNRFKDIFAAAGHPNAVFKIDFKSLKEITKGAIFNITE